MRTTSVLIALFLLAATAPAQDPVTHEVDPGRRYQVMDHFGASDCWTTRVLGQWSQKNRERVADLLFSRDKRIGLSLWRFNLGAGLQPKRIPDPLRTTESFEVRKGRYDWSRMKAERAMLLAAKARGVTRFHAFSLSGTPRMTRNGFVNADAGRHTTNLRLGAEADYARYLADVVEQFARGYPDWRVFQTEYCVMQRGRDLGMNTALHLARVLHGDLSIVNTAGWSWWLAFSPHDYKDGLLYTNWKRAGDQETILTSKTFWVFGQHSRFVRPGMQGIAVDGPGLQNHAGLLATAYHDAKTGRIAVVYVNSGHDGANVRLRVKDGHRKPAKQQAHLTSAAESDNLRALPATAFGVALSIPARSVVTVVLDGEKEKDE